MTSVAFLGFIVAFVLFFQTKRREARAREEKRDWVDFFLNSGIYFNSGWVGLILNRHPMSYPSRKKKFLKKNPHKLKIAHVINPLVTCTPS
jgi:hypothetical protein